MEKYCNNSWTQIVELLNSNSEQGIGEKYSEALRVKYGTNKIDLPSGNRLYKHVFDALRKKAIIIYIIITIILFVLRHYLFGGIVILMLILNLIIMRRELLWKLRQLSLQ